MFALGLVFIFLGFLSYQRGWAKRASRKAIYKALLGKLDAAREKYTDEPTMINQLEVDKCTLISMYEGQKGRAKRRLGLFLMVTGIILAVIYR